VLYHDELNFCQVNSAVCLSFSTRANSGMFLPGHINTRTGVRTRQKDPPCGRNPQPAPGPTRQTMICCFLAGVPVMLSPVSRSEVRW